MAFRVVFLAHASDAEPERDRSLVETSTYRLYTVVVKNQVQAVAECRRLQDMQAVVENNVADAISMSRPFIMDPYLVKHLRDGSTDYSECTSCNVCIDQMSPGDFGCILV